MTNLTFIFVKHFFRVELSQGRRRESRGSKILKISYLGLIHTCVKFEPNLKWLDSELCSLDVE